MSSPCHRDKEIVSQTDAVVSGSSPTQTSREQDHANRGESARGKHLEVQTFREWLNRKLRWPGTCPDFNHPRNADLDESVRDENPDHVAPECRANELVG